MGEMGKGKALAFFASYQRHLNKAPGRGFARAQHCTLVCFSHKFARRQDRTCIIQNFVARIERSEIRDPRLYFTTPRLRNRRPRISLRSIRATRRHALRRQSTQPPQRRSRMRPRRMIAVRPRLGLAGEAAAGVGVMGVARRIHGVGRGVDPDDPAAGAAQPRIVLGLEREEMPGPVRSRALRGRLSWREDR